MDNKQYCRPGARRSHVFARLSQNTDVVLHSLAVRWKQYECRQRVGTASETDEHHVTVRHIAGNEFQWTNRAGATWKLTANIDCSLLQVHPECSFYAQGYTECRVETNADGVKILYGPEDELFVRTAALDGGDANALKDQVRIS